MLTVKLKITAWTRQGRMMVLDPAHTAPETDDGATYQLYGPIKKLGASGHRGSVVVVAHSNKMG